MAIVLKSGKAAQLASKLRALTGAAFEDVLATLIEGELARRGIAESIVVNTSPERDFPRRKLSRYELAEHPDEFVYGPLPLVFKDHLDEEPAARVRRLLDLVRAWGPIPPGTVFADADEIMGFDDGNPGR
jgi:hypothetical protein